MLCARQCIYFYYMTKRNKNQGLSTFTARLDRALDSDLFKTLSESIRCKILRIVAINGPMDVMSVAEYFSQDRSVISRHLTMMAAAGILKSEKNKRSKIYWVNGPAILEKLERMTETVRFLTECKCDD